VKPILIVFLGLAVSLFVAAQDIGTRSSQQPDQTIQLTPAQQEARNELDEAVRAYKEGNFATAQMHSEKALALDPLNKTATLFIARTIHAQYKPGTRSEANVTKARDAINAYKQILVQEPLNEEAYKAVAYLYGSLKEDELLRQWVLQRAVDPNVSPDRRAEAFVVLASKYWDCSFKITELPTNKITTVKEHSAQIHYIKPGDLEDFEKAWQCAADGLQMVESAIGLSPENESAWSYKTNLFLELSKLAEMDNKLNEKTEYQKQFATAQRRTFELSRKNPNPGCCLELPKVKPLELPKSKP
jgi:tetratricopeptide (TPR) repeat protein